MESKIENKIISILEMIAYSGAMLLLYIMVEDIVNKF